MIFLVYCFPGCSVEDLGGGEALVCLSPGCIDNNIVYVLTGGWVDGVHLEQSSVKLNGIFFSRFAISGFTPDDNQWLIGHYYSQTPGRHARARARLSWSIPSPDLHLVHLVQIPSVVFTCASHRGE